MAGMYFEIFPHLERKGHSFPPRPSYTRAGGAADPVVPAAPVALAPLATRVVVWKVESHSSAFLHKEKISIHRELLVVCYTFYFRSVFTFSANSHGSHTEQKRNGSKRHLVQRQILSLPVLKWLHFELFHLAFV